MNIKLHLGRKIRKTFLEKPSVSIFNATLIAFPFVYILRAFFFNSIVQLPLELRQFLLPTPSRSKSSFLLIFIFRTY